DDTDNEQACRNVLDACRARVFVEITSKPGRTTSAIPQAFVSPPLPGNACSNLPRIGLGGAGASSPGRTRILEANSRALQIVFEVAVLNVESVPIGGNVAYAVAAGGAVELFGIAIAASNILPAYRFAARHGARGQSLGIVKSRLPQEVGIVHAKIRNQAIRQSATFAR